MKYKVRTLNKKPSINDSIVAVYHANAKQGDMPCFIGPRKKARIFIQNNK